MILRIRLSPEARQEIGRKRGLAAAKRRRGDDHTAPSLVVHDVVDACPQHVEGGRRRPGMQRHDPTAFHALVRGKIERFQSLPRSGDIVRYLRLLGRRSRARGLGLQPSLLAGFFEG